MSDTAELELLEDDASSARMGRMGSRVFDSIRPAGISAFWRRRASSTSCTVSRYPARRVRSRFTRIAVSRETALGSMTGWRPAMPVTQWSWVKP